MEQISLKEEAKTDARAASRLEALAEEAAQLSAEQEELSARWQAEKSALDGVRDLKSKIEAINLEIEQAEQAYELSRAAELKYSVLPGLQEKLAAEEAAAEDDVTTG